MPEEKKQGLTRKQVGIGAGTIGALSAQNRVIDHLDKVKTLKNPQARTSYLPKESLTESHINPHKNAQALRQQRRAGKAVARTNASKLASRAASKTLGAAGLVVGAPNAIESASRIDKEGGTFAARFGKFVEELTGMPSGSSWRPPTKKEQERDLSI